MRTGPAMVAQLETSPEPVHPRVHESLRNLVELAEDLARQTGTPSTDNANNTEEILLDVDVDGCRYLLVRMPRALRSRVQLSPREEEIVRMGLRVTLDRWTSRGVAEFDPSYPLV